MSLETSNPPRRLLSEETRRKMSLAAVGRKTPPEIRLKLSVAKMGEKNHRFGKPVSVETRQKISEALRGRPSPNRGRKITEETRVRLVLAQRNRKPVSQETRAKQSLARRGKRHSLEFRRKGSEAKKGEKNPAWRGGVSSENNRVRHSLDYRLWREAVFRRDGHSCVLCGVKSAKGKTVVLNADHIKPFAYFPELRFDISNGRTLCEPCHKQTDTFGHKAHKHKETL